MNEPAHIVGVDLMFDGPLCQFVPLFSGASVDGESQLYVLVLTLLQVGHHLLGSSDTEQSAGDTSAAKCPVLSISRHLDDVAKVFPLDVVVSFDEDLSQDGLTDGIVFGIELIKAMESVSVL